MKNFEKVIKELDTVSKEFYVGGSLSLFVFNYISRIPKDLDIQTNDEIFLAFAKEKQETAPITQDNRWKVRHIIEPDSYDEPQGSDIPIASEDRSLTEHPEREQDPAFKYGFDGKLICKTWLTVDEKLDFLKKQRNPFSTYASFSLHNTKVEIYKNDVEKHHNIYGYRFVDPNEVLYWKVKYQGRNKDKKDLLDALDKLYPGQGRDSRKWLSTDDILFDYGLHPDAVHPDKAREYMINKTPRRLIEEVLNGNINPNPLKK
jgi:hypothetical protein